MSKLSNSLHLSEYALCTFLSRKNTLKIFSYALICQTQSLNQNGLGNWFRCQLWHSCLHRQYETNSDCEAQNFNSEPAKPLSLRMNLNNNVAEDFQSNIVYIL
jgi:hypothetical protein